MGTRNLTMVVYKNQTKVAQYGQWDGYLAGQGVTILEFLKKINNKNIVSRWEDSQTDNNIRLLTYYDIEKFKQKIAMLKWLTSEQADDIERYANIHNDWQKKYPYLSRDTGGKLLEMIYESNDILGLTNSESFAGDSLFCEWGYVVDLDKNVFEVYKGFNKEKLTEKDRFYGLFSNNSYHPIKIAKSYSLFDLPTNENFLNNFNVGYDE
jgi:hypothetical protein